MVLGAAPVVLASCVDLSTLAGGAPDGGSEGGSASGTDEGGVPTAKCPPNQKSCGGGCVPTDAPEYGCSADSCERCSVPFAETVICENGQCAVGTCAAGRGSCDGNKQNGCEANLATAATCGSCTAACPTATPLCNAGACVKSCPPGTTQCNSQCVDLQTTADNCGACDKVCAGGTNATGICVAGACTFACNAGFGDCDSNLANGCEDLRPYYTDGDNDGVGGGDKVGEACVAPAGTSLVAGDCVDTNAKVKPGQSTYFATGYTTASGVLSYDYDCNGAEEHDPTKPVGGCTICRVHDYVSVGRPSYPPMHDIYCGSTTVITGCSSASCSVSTATPVGCR
jgi:hypothetical protein